MNIRIARHTNQLERMLHFYQQIIGLEKLGSFSNHEGYDGVFLGIPGVPWHLEFTTSSTAAEHHEDEDDFLVFYVKDQNEFDQFLQKFKDKNIPLLKAKNPYWNKYGIVIKDPDNFKIIVAITN